MRDENGDDETDLGRGFGHNTALDTTRSDRRGWADERGDGRTEVERAHMHAHARCSKYAGFPQLEKKIEFASTAARCSGAVSLADPQGLPRSRQKKALFVRTDCRRTRGLLPGLPRDQFAGPWLFSTAEARAINSSSANARFVVLGSQYFGIAKTRARTATNAQKPHK